MYFGELNVAVFVLDKHKHPLMPCSEKRARLLLERKRAVVHRRHPFTIRLKDRVGGAVQPMRLKFDPGAKTTGVALVREDDDGETQHVLHLAEIEHKGELVHSRLEGRANYRRRRRSANLRYRAARFDNQRVPCGWLTPSLRSRLDNLSSWTARYRRLAPIAALSVESVRFDLQKAENPEIQGIEYQQGTLFGYEVREYVLAKWGRRCAYCDAENVPLEVEHIHSRARGGSNRVSNLALACRPCNQAKGAQPIERFLAKQPERLKRIQTQRLQPLNAAAAVNAMRRALWRQLAATGLPVESASGGRTKWNRARLGIPKTHALDAAVVGNVSAVAGWARPVLSIKAMGRGAYQRTRLNSYGFPHGYLIRSKQVHGFKTGDLVRAIVPRGKKTGTHVGRVAIRATGSFNIQTATTLLQGIRWKHCHRLARADGYLYSTRSAPPLTEVRGFRAFST